MTTADPAAPAAGAPPAASSSVVPFHIWVGFIAMIFGNFIAMLDIQIVASALGSIQAGVGASRDEISRVQSAYLIAEVIGIPLSGFLGRALGIRLLFSLSAISFGIASAMCALAWDMTSLVAFRAIQGFVGAAMIPTTMSTLYTLFPREQQGMAGSMVGLVSSLGPTLGPSLGGYIAEHFGWRMLFWINIVPTIIIAVLVWRFMRGGPKAEPVILKKIDFIGLAGLALFLGCLEYVLDEGPGDNWFADGEIVIFSVVCLFSGMLFFWRATNAEVPIVDLRPFGNITFATGAMLGFLIGIGLFAPIFLQPLFLGQIRGLNSEQIGHMMWAQGLTMMIVMPIFGSRLRQIQDLRPFGFAGFLIVALSCWLQTQLTAQSGFYAFLVPQILRGVGMMFMFMSVMQPALQALPPHLIQSATGLFNLCRNLGGALGLAILTTIQTHFYALHRQELYAGANKFDPHVAGLIEMNRRYLEQTGAADPERQSVMRYVSLLDREALVMTFNDQFLMLTIVLLIGSVFIWAIKRSDHPVTEEELKAMREAH